jgi:hypothetical protein
MLQKFFLLLKEIIRASKMCDLSQKKRPLKIVSLLYLYNIDLFFKIIHEFANQFYQ